MRAEGGKKGKGIRREKKRKKEEKKGFFFIKPRAGFFHMRSGHFSNIKGKLYLDLVDHIRFCLQSKF